jgi:uncharacterized protein YprB with RNaseH-like and TPR domain
MSIEEIVVRMSAKRYMLEMGCGKLAKWFKCSKEDIKKAKKIVRKSEVRELKKPKLLFLDIETAPLKAYTWGLWKQDIYSTALISDWFMLSWSAKWLDDDAVMSQSLNQNEVLEENDKRIVETLWFLINQADIVCAHNGKRFDIPRIRSRFLVNGLPPTRPYLQIDTLEVAKREFGFSSNRLDALAQILGLDRKLETGMALWVKCMQGDEEALKEMESYNRQDVIVLQEVYIKFRPFVKTHPNYNLWSQSINPVCPHCGSENLIKEHGHYYTQTAQYDLHKCLDCGAISRERKTSLPKNKNILVSIPGR